MCVWISTLCWSITQEKTVNKSLVLFQTLLNTNYDDDVYFNILKLLRSTN